jgi:hypothetical protein
MSTDERVVTGRALVSIHLAGHLALGGRGSSEQGTGGLVGKSFAALPSFARAAPHHLHTTYIPFK